MAVRAHGPDGRPLRLYEEASVTTAEARPAAVEQLRLMLVVALAAEWRGFARDLHYDAVEAVTAAMAQRESERGCR